MIILSVDATPVNPDPSPTNDVAVTTPANVVFPFAAIVPPTPATPTSRPPVAVTIPTALISVAVVSPVTVKSCPTVKFPVELSTVATLNALYATHSRTSPFAAASTRATVDPSVAV